MEKINFLPILMIIIGLSTFCLFLYFNFDILQPTISFFLVMTISLGLGTVNIERWNLYVGPDTSLIVIAGMFSFAIGASFVHYSFYKRNDNVQKMNEQVYFGIYHIPKVLIFICTSIVLILAYFSFKELYDLSIQLGNQDGVANMIKTLRYPLERGQIHFSRWISYREVVAMVIATSFLYFFINNLIINGRFKLVDSWFILPVLASFSFFVLSTGRRSLIHFIICGLILGAILYQQKYGISYKVKVKILELIGLTGIFAIVLYFVLGFLTGKVSVGGRSPLTIIAHYGGLSVPALEQYVSTPHVESQYILQNTMMGIYGNLNSLGFNLELGHPFLPFVEFQGTEHIDTNVYTIFYRLLADYSFPGMIIIMFLFGVLLTYCYDCLKHADKPELLAIYAYYGYIPFFLFIDDQFMGLFTTRTIYFVCLLYSFIYLLRKKYFTLLSKKQF